MENNNVQLVIPLLVVYIFKTRTISKKNNNTSHISIMHLAYQVISHMQTVSKQSYLEFSCNLFSFSKRLQLCFQIPFGRQPTFGNKTETNLLIDWCLTPTLAVFQLNRGVNKLSKLNSITTRLFKNILLYKCDITPAYFYVFSLII